LSLIESITSELTTFLKPYLNNERYGNIIVPAKFPSNPRGSTNWAIAYSTLMGIGSEIRIREQDGKWYYSFAIPIPKEEAVKLFKMAVISIPFKRRERLRDWLESGKSLEDLENSFSSKIDQWHTEEEIDYARSLESELK